MLCHVSNHDKHVRRILDKFCVSYQKRALLQPYLFIKYEGFMLFLSDVSFTCQSFIEQATWNDAHDLHKMSTETFQTWDLAALVRFEDLCQ